MTQCEVEDRLDCHYKGGLETGIYSCPYHDSTTAVQINITYTVIYKTFLAASVYYSPPVSVMEIKYDSSPTDFVCYLELCVALPDVDVG